MSNNLGKKIAVVTGANKGIGLEIAKGLLERGYRVIATARDVTRGTEAVATLQSSDVVFLPLDLDNQETIKSCAEKVKEQFGEIDVLVNNAAIAFKASSTVPFEQQARPTVATNYFGTLQVCEAFFPLIKPGGKVVNLASRAGHLKVVKSQQLLDKLQSPSLTVDELNDIMNGFVSDVEANSMDKWARSCYGASKMGVIALTRIHARELKPRNIQVHSCCPGYCQTDMSSNNGDKSAKEGADTPLWLATTDLEQSGLFYGERQELVW